MLTDSYGKEVKVGDHVIYPITSGHGSGRLGEYEILSIEERPHRYRTGEFEHIVRARPIRRQSQWSFAGPFEKNQSGRPVTFTHPKHIVVITGLDLHTRYGEPGDVHPTA